MFCSKAGVQQSGLSVTSEQGLLGNISHLCMPAARVIHYENEIYHRSCCRATFAVALVEIRLHKDAASIRKSIVYSGKVALSETRQKVALNKSRHAHRSSMRSYLP